MLSWETRQKLAGIYNIENYKEKIITDSKNEFIKHKEYSINKSVGLLDGVSVSVLIYNHTNPLDEYKEDRKLLCEEELPIHRGSVYISDNEEYIVITDIDSNGIYETAKIRKATHNLKFRSPISRSIIYSTPAIVSNATMYSDGLEQGKVMVLPDSKRNIVMPNNDETSLLTEGMRMIIGSKVYSLSHIDSDTMPGILSIICNEENKDDRDNFTTGIAYNEGDDVVTDVYSIRITNEYAITLGYYTNWQIQWEVLKNGEVTNLPVVFTSSNTSAVTVNTSGLCTSKAINASSNITVKLASNQSVFTTVGITVNNELAHKYTVNINGADEITLGTVNNYSAVVSDKGVAMSNYAIDWSIDYLDCLTSIAVLKNATDKGVQVEVNNGNMIGKINLIAKYRTDNTVYVIKQLTISAGGYW